MVKKEVNYVGPFAPEEVLTHTADSCTVELKENGVKAGVFYKYVGSKCVRVFAHIYSTYVRTIKIYGKMKDGRFYPEKLDKIVTFDSRAINDKICRSTGIIGDANIIRTLTDQEVKGVLETFVEIVNETAVTTNDKKVCGFFSFLKDYKFGLTLHLDHKAIKTLGKLVSKGYTRLTCDLKEAYLLVFYGAEYKKAKYVTPMKEVFDAHFRGYCLKLYKTKVSANYIRKTRCSSNMEQINAYQIFLIIILTFCLKKRMFDLVHQLRMEEQEGNNISIA